MADLLDTYLPRFDVRDAHRIHVRAAPAVTYAALTATDLGQSPVVGLHVALRSMPASLSNGLAGLRDLMWQFIAPASGLIRRAMLRTILDDAERGTNEPGGQ